MTLFSKSYISYGVKVLLCVFSKQQIGRGHVHLEYPKSAKNTAMEYTQEVLRVKCEFIIFPGSFLLYVQTNKCSLRPVVKLIMCPCATPRGTCRRGTLCEYIQGSPPGSKCQGEWRKDKVPLREVPRGVAQGHIIYYPTR